MFQRSYKVGAVAFLGREPGEEIPADAFKGLNVDALVEGGIIEVSSVEKESCPACEADKNVKRVPKFENLGALRDHYFEKHRALSSPG